jgi:lipoate-protein ligase A
VPSPPEKASGWQVRRHELGAGDFHALDVDAPATRSVWISRPPRPAVVLGSTQDPAIIDEAVARHRGVEVVRRRSGGGAVLVVPGEMCWIDLVIGRDDRLWADDVGRAMHWVGAVWQAALVDQDLDVSVHRGPLLRTAWSDVVCFAGVGPGEVVGDRGAKVVGISQRRTRAWARFQTAALVRWDPVALTDLLAVDPPDGERALAQAARGTGVRDAVLEAAFLRHLPAD